jgi:hypothetical protein
MAIPKKNKAEEEQSPESQLSERYPDPAVEVLDPSFAKYRIFNAAVERLAGGMRWSEGPVWFGGGRYLLWSDLPNNRIMKWEEETGHVIVFRKPSNYANGNTQDRQGRLVTCEHCSRRVTDGSITVILDRYAGKPLNSPNDVVVKSDGSIWFSDPPFGIAGNYEGNAATPELPQNVYRVDGEMGQASVVASDLRGPNGLCFSEAKHMLTVCRAYRTTLMIFRRATSTSWRSSSETFTKPLSLDEYLISALTIASRAFTARRWLPLAHPRELAQRNKVHASDHELDQPRAIQQLCLAGPQFFRGIKASSRFITVI